MEITDAETLLYERLIAPRDAARTHRQAIDTLLKTPPTLRDYAVIGIDTNILKALRRDVTRSDGMFLTIKDSGVQLVTPGQSLIEFWNNHQIFANDEWGTIKNDLSRLDRKIDRDALSGQDIPELHQLRELVDTVSADLQEARSPEFLSNSRGLIGSLLETSTVPMVSRVRFAEIARVRTSSKLPPGFADDKLKAASHGDFYAWCDFMLGVLCAGPHEDTARVACAWVTDDVKPDWKTGTGAHPALVEEFAWVCERELTTLSSREFDMLVAASTEISPNSDDPDMDQ